MSLLMAVSNTNKITVIVLCIAVIVFVLTDIALVISLHKHNKRIARRKKLTEAEREENKERVEINE